MFQKENEFSTAVQGCYLVFFYFWETETVSVRSLFLG